jgi:hypothetical protein
MRTSGERLEQEARHRQTMPAWWFGPFYRLAKEFCGPTSLKIGNRHDFQLFIQYPNVTIDAGVTCLLTEKLAILSLAFAELAIPAAHPARRTSPEYCDIFPDEC